MLWLSVLCLSVISTLSAQGVPDMGGPGAENLVRQTPMHEVTFRFVAGRDMFLSPWGGNGESLSRLSAFIEAHRGAILSGEAPVRVYGYCASVGTPAVRRSRARAMSNRVKSEMILHHGLREELFRTENSTEACGELHNAVVVRIALPQSDADSEQSGGQPVADADALPVADALSTAADKAAADKVAATSDPALSAERTASEGTASEGTASGTAASEGTASERTAATASEAATALLSPLPRWSIGLNIGIPFFWGDMVSMSADKTYVGFAAGIQGSYRFGELLGVTLSADYARGKTGARDYARSYQLAPSGMTLYSVGTDHSEAYGELYSRVSLVNLGLGVDVHLNRLLGSRATRGCFQAVLTPTLYGQFFSVDVFRKADGSRFSDGSTEPDAVSLGLGGALSLRYRIAPAWEVQLKNSVLWMTDNCFDGIVTPYGHARHNALWMPQLGVLWRL